MLDPQAHKVGVEHARPSGPTKYNALAFDHEKLSYPHNGRNMRLTDVSGTVMREALA